MGLIGSIVLGCLAGFCAGKLMKGGGLGFMGWHTGTTGYSHHRCRCYSLGSLADQEIRNPK